MTASASCILDTRALGNINSSSDPLNGHSWMTEMKKFTFKNDHYVQFSDPDQSCKKLFVKL